MKLRLELPLAFTIGFIFRLALELLYPYSPIGFDPMGYYAPMLYSGFSIYQLIPVGPVYYVIAGLLNDLMRNPILTLKILDSIISGLYLFSIFFFSNRKFGHTNSLLFSILAFLSFQSLSLEWGLERNLLAFSVLVLALTIDTARNRNLLVIFVLLTLTAFTDPAVIPIGFVYYVISSTKNFRLIVFPIYYSLLTITFIALSTTGGETFMSMFISFFSSVSLYPTIVMALLFLAPFLLLGKETLKLGKIIKEKFQSSTLFISLIIPSLVLLTLSYRYLAELSTMFMILLKSPSLNRRRVVAVITVTMLISLSYVALSNENPSPYLNNPLSVRSGEIDLFGVSFLQSTIPLGQSSDVLSLFKDIPTNNSIIVAMLYTVGFAYESGFNSSKIVNTGENFTLFLEDCFAYTSKGIQVYTVWWISNGWYGIKSLPSNFRILGEKGQFALYEYFN